MKYCIKYSTPVYNVKVHIDAVEFAWIVYVRKTCKFTFFHEKWETLKKVFFQKVPQNRKNLSASILFPPWK